jgi:recombination protein RecA
MNEAGRREAILRRLARMNDSGPHSRPIPSGFPSLDRMMGGGFPRGRMLEFFGPAGGGKTTLALQCIAHAQRLGFNAAFIDADQTFDGSYAATLGVDIAKLPLAQPADAEEALEIASALAGSGAIDLIVVDSAAALTARLEIRAGIGESAPGLQSRVLSNELRKLSASLRRGEASVLFLNQARNRAEGEGETSAGGHPLKLFAAVRIAMNRAGASRLRFRVLKNRTSAESDSAELEWRSGAGFAEPE